MKRLLFLPLVLLIFAGIAAGQVQYPKGSLAGSTTVASLPLIGNSNLLWDVRDGNPGCTAGGGTTRVVCHWNGATYDTQATVGGSGVGTVTSVSGTANQVSVATGTTTPVVSLTAQSITGNFISGLTSTATAAATTTLTVTSKRTQVFTGSTTQTITLPVVTTLLQVGFSFDIQNDSSGALTVNSSGGNLVQTMATGTRATITCKLLTGTSAASWNVTYISSSGGGLTSLNGDTTAAQIIAAGSGVSIVDTGATHTISAIGAGDTVTTSILLSSTTVDLNEGTGAKQPLYTVPASRKAVITAIVFQKFSGNGNVFDVVFGWNAGGDNLTNDIQATVTSSSTLFLPSASLQFINPYPIGAAAEVVGFKVLNPEGVALTAKVDVYGYLTDTNGVPVSNVGGTGAGAALAPASVTTAGGVGVGVAAPAVGFALDKTVTTGGTTGAQTINKPSGSVNFATAATSLVVTNSLVTASSVIQCTVGTNDATMKSVQCVAGSGSFTVYPNAAPTAETRVNFTITN